MINFPYYNFLNSILISKYEKQFFLNYIPLVLSLSIFTLIYDLFLIN